jgi:hypothetical protein
MPPYRGLFPVAFALGVMEREARFRERIRRGHLLTDLIESIV